MSALGHRGGIVIALSLALALMLHMVPLPGWAAAARPEWLLLVVVYWCLALPERVGVGVAWFAGLLLDVVQSSLLGQHALAMALVAYLAIKLHQRIRVFPLPQQAATVLLLAGLYALADLWVRGMTGHAPSVWRALLPALTTAALWPVAFVTLRFLRRYYRVA